MTSGRSGLADLLAGRDYRRMLATRIFAQFGDGSFQVALAGMFFFSPERQTTPGGVAWALTASLLPYTVIGPFAGVLLDRWYRRQVLVVANAIRAGLVLLAAALIYTSTVNAALLVVVLCCLSVDRFVLAGLGAALPHVVRPTQLVLANSITPTIGTISTVCGGALGLALGRLLGGNDGAAALAMSLPVLAYLGSGLAVSRLPVAALGPDGGPVRAPILGQLLDLAVGMGHGARHLWQRRAARECMLLTATIRIGFAGFAIATILLCRNTFSSSADEGLEMVALVAALAGAGTGLAAVVVPLGARLLGLGGWVVACLLGMTLIYLTYALAMSPAVLIGGALPLGLCVQGVKVGVDTTLQRSVGEGYLGRAFSLYDMVFNASFVVAAVITVLTVPASGHALGLFCGAAGLSLAMAIATSRGTLPRAVWWRSRST